MLAHEFPAVLARTGRTYSPGWPENAHNCEVRGAAGSWLASRSSGRLTLRATEVPRGPDAEVVGPGHDQGPNLLDGLGPVSAGRPPGDHQRAPNGDLASFWDPLACGQLRRVKAVTDPEDRIQSKHRAIGKSRVLEQMSRYVIL